MACVCPDIEREIGRMMNFMTEVTGDALEAMQDVWDERESFTRLELGWVPSWAEYVGESGELFSRGELADAFENDLTGCYDMVSVCGYEYEAGRALRELDPTAFRCGFLDWLSGRVQDGELRSIEG
nr:MAG TPA: hypothetical protein [Caudoviricetes sp.]